MKKTLLFVTYGGGHVHMVYPVVHALRESAPHRNGDLEIHVLALPAAKAALRAQGVDCLGFRDYLDADADTDALAWGRALAKDHHSPTIGAELEDSVAYLGLSYKDLVTRLGPGPAEELFRREARHAFFPLTIMERIFDDLRPDFVVATNSPRSEAAAIEVANRRGIGTLIMADLFTGLGTYPLRATHITFLNEAAKDMFASDGLVDAKASAFHYTGNPAFDRLLRLPADKDPDWVRLHFPGGAGKPLILHADMPAYWDPRSKRSRRKTDAEILEELGACHDAALANDAAYLIRPHPSQDRTIYLTWLRDRRDAWLAADVDLHDLLRNIDLLIARTTTVGLEAAYMGKRVLQLDRDFHTDFPLANMGVAWGVNSYGELPGGIRSALTDDATFAEILNRIERTLPREPAAPKIAEILLREMYHPTKNGAERR